MDSIDYRYVYEQGYQCLAQYNGETLIQKIFLPEKDLKKVLDLIESRLASNER